MVNARAIELTSIFAVEAITFGEKECERARMREGNRVANPPRRVEVGRRIVRSAKRIVNGVVLLFQIDIGIEIGQVEKSPRTEHRRGAVTVEGEKPNTRHAIKVNIGPHV